MRAIWQRYCQEQTPAALSIDDQGQAFFEDKSDPVSLQHPGSSGPKSNGFEWTFQGKIIAVDNGAQLLRHPVVDDLLSNQTIELVAFDPGGHADAHHRTGLHYYANNSLGDGRPTTFHACLDPAKSSALEPLPPEQLEPTDSGKAQVLARVPYQTVALDTIDGLTRIEWLILDGLSDSASILAHGRKILKDALLIQAQVVFQPTHCRQPSLAELQHWASRNGFRFYRLHDAAYRRFMPDSTIEEESHQTTELIVADVVAPARPGTYANAR